MCNVVGNVNLPLPFLKMANYYLGLPLIWRCPAKGPQWCDVTDVTLIYAPLVNKDLHKSITVTLLHSSYFAYYMTLSQQLSVLVVWWLIYVQSDLQVQAVEQQEI